MSVVNFHFYYLGGQNVVLEIKKLPIHFISIGNLTYFLSDNIISIPCSVILWSFIHSIDL